MLEQKNQLLDRLLLVGMLGLDLLRVELQHLHLELLVRLNLDQELLMGMELFVPLLPRIQLLDNGRS